MNRWSALTAMAVFGVAVFAAQAAPPEGDGWVSLFNGKDLDGWEIRSEHEGIWAVKDGVIDCMPRSDKKGDNCLWSKKELGDFELHVEWRLKETKGLYGMRTILPDGTDKLDEDGNVIVTMAPNADSGIYLRGSSKSQINIWCWPIGSGEVWGYRTDPDMPPDVRAGAVPKVCADKPLGEWNTFKITMKGEELTLLLNGKKVLDKAKLPGVPKAGPIALQHHGGYNEARDSWSTASSLIQFRNIYCRETGKN